MIYTEDLKIMTGFYILFYIFAVYLSCQAAPAERDIGGSGYSLIMEGLEIQDDEPVFPPFNCTPAEFSESKDRLFIGLLALYRYITVSLTHSYLVYKLKNYFYDY